MKSIILPACLILYTVATTSQAAAAPSEPYRMWYRTPYIRTNPDLYKYANWENSGQSALKDIYKSMGITMGKWGYGPQSPYSGGNPDYFKLQCYYDSGGPYSAVGLDEWAGTTNFDICAEGIRRAKAEWPRLFISVYTVGAETNLVSLLKDGSVDLAIIEGYTHAPDIGGIGRLGLLARGNKFKELGLSDKTIVMIGHVMDSMGEKHLRLVTGLTHDMWPEFPGIGFYGRLGASVEADKKMLALADKLSNFYWGDNVLFSDGFESYSFAEGRWRKSGSAVIREGFNWRENDAGQFWTGGDFQFSGTGIEATAPLTDPGPVHLDIADMVISWVAGRKANRGLLVQLGDPIYGLPGGTGRSASFHSVESADVAKRPRLDIRFKHFPTITKTPVDDGWMSYRQEFGRKMFDSKTLLTHFNPWWDYTAIYLRFDMSDITPKQIADMISATLTLEAIEVKNPQHVALRARRIHPANSNTESVIKGCDNEKCVTLRDGGSISRKISTAGRENIKLEYIYKIFKTSSRDGLLVEWYDGLRWKTAARIAGVTDNFVRGRNVLPVNAGNNRNFAIRFTAAKGTETKVYLDLIRVVGNVKVAKNELPRSKQRSI